MHWNCISGTNSSIWISTRMPIICTAFLHIFFISCLQIYTEWAWRIKKNCIKLHICWMNYYLSDFTWLSMASVHLPRTNHILSCFELATQTIPILISIFFSIQSYSWGCILHVIVWRYSNGLCVMLPLLLSTTVYQIDVLIQKNTWLT